MAVSDFLEPAVKDYAEQAKATYSAPIDTSQFTGRGFVAGEDPLQTQAINLAQQGVGSYQPFLAAAQTAQTAGAGALGQSAATIGGLGALTGPQAYQPFMSPYQSQVIDATLSEFDKQRLGGEQAIKDQAVASGNFGGGREGAMLGQYQADSLADRSALQASMLQQGFGQANQLAQQNFMNQGSIANAQQGLAGAYGNQMNQQFGLSDFGRTGMGQDVSALGSLGAMRQGLGQAQLSADQQAAQTAAYEPYGRLSQYGNTLTGLMGGVSGQQYQDPRAANPFQTALGTATGLAGLYGKIFR
jgi:hypothetical protein|tara:strand:- start:16 stop:918 length:903 start_codon:yes stop_codon:yes gene_type:complete